MLLYFWLQLVLIQCVPANEWTKYTGEIIHRLVLITNSVSASCEENQGTLTNAEGSGGML